MSQTVFKVVRVHHGVLVSAFTGGNSQCRYGTNIKTVTKNGTPLLAFRRRDQAVEFMTDLGLCNWPFELWEAEAEGVRCIESVCSRAEDTQRQFWDGKLDEMLFAMSAPRGTVACDSIQLTKYIPWEEA